MKIRLINKRCKTRGATARNEEQIAMMLRKEDQDDKKVHKITSPQAYKALLDDDEGVKHIEAIVSGSVSA